MRCHEEPDGPVAEIALSVPDMRCRHCARAVSARVGDVAGVVAVEADVTSATVRVRGTSDVEALRSAVADAGHAAMQLRRNPQSRKEPSMALPRTTMPAGRTPHPGRFATTEGLRPAWAQERAEARAARRRGDPTAEWGHLERAHILSQPMALPHVRTHLAMAGFAVRRHDRREIAGQLVRLVLAAPGSLSGRYPVGNTGGADVSAFRPMPLPDDLRALLEGPDAGEAVR